MTVDDTFTVTGWGSGGEEWLRCPIWAHETLHRQPAWEGAFWKAETWQLRRDPWICSVPILTPLEKPWHVFLFEWHFKTSTPTTPWTQAGKEEARASPRAGSHRAATAKGSQHRFHMGRLRQHHTKHRVRAGRRVP